MRNNKFLMDRSAENNDQDQVRVMMDEMVLEDEMVDQARVMMDEEMVLEDEIKNMRMKFVLDVAPVEIIDKEDDEDFINSVVENIDQIELVIHVIDHDIMYQYWSLKSGNDSLNSSSLSSSSCHHQHHHHLGDDDDEDMIMITCQPTFPPRVDKILVNHQDIFANCKDDDYIMSLLLHDVDVLYEFERLPTKEHLEEVKRCIMQRISEAKPAVLMAKPKTVRIRVHLSTIEKRYYATSAAATSAAAQDTIGLRECAAACATHFSTQPRPPSPPTKLEYKDEMKPALRALRSSKEALETKICEKEDLISSSSLPCPVCLIEFRVGVDGIMIMPCSHVFHWTCLTDWLHSRNTCPICRYELPAWKPMSPGSQCQEKAKNMIRWRD